MRKINAGLVALILLLFVSVIGLVLCFAGSTVSNDTDNGKTNENEATNDSNVDSAYTNNAILVEDATITSYSYFNSKCSMGIKNSNGEAKYEFGANNAELFLTLRDYMDYIKLDIYYTQEGDKKTIVDYKFYLKSNNEEITGVSDESELRSKIGLYSLGTHTGTFTLTEIGTTGFGFDDDESYTYIDYTMVDEKNNEYEMRYIIPNGTNALNLIKGNSYSVSFEVVEEVFGYKFYIKSVN